jgi:hypothetical protein
VPVLDLPWLRVPGQEWRQIHELPEIGLSLFLSMYYEGGILRRFSLGKERARTDWGVDAAELFMRGLARSIAVAGKLKSLG